MDLKTSKILVVDDNSFYLSLLKTILKDLDAEIFLAGSGEDALKMIHKNDFALAILDIQMPGMDGFELARQIRVIQNIDLIPIIFLTAYFSDDLQMFKGYDHGAIDYLTKPVNKSILLSKVKIFLDLDQQKKSLLRINKSLQNSKIELELKQKELKIQNEALKVAQVETEESRKKYFKLYDFAPTGYCTISPNGRILDINLKGANMFENEPSNLINLKFINFISKDSQLVLEQFLHKIFDNNLHSGCEIRLKSSIKRTVYLYLEGAIIDDNQKCLLSMVDITDRKEAQMALIESEELYHSLLKTSPDGIVITDLEGKITEASDIAQEQIGKNRTIEGRHFLEFIPDESKVELATICKTTLRYGMVQNFEIKLKRNDQSEFYGEVSTTQIKGNDGEIKAFMSVIRNITERKKIEKQLRHTERMTGIGELATGMAHEINQPLNTISLSLDNVMFSVENNSCSETYLKSKIEKVFDNISRIKKIIDHVRTFSRDQEDFTQSAFDINASIQNSISMISEQFSHREIELNFVLDENLPYISGNAYRFEQVILNMMINAKDAIEEKKKTSTKKFRKRVDIITQLHTKNIIIEIKDNGIGIKPEVLDKVLLPFFTTKAPGQGTGLGLSISYGIIKELGGEIEVQSKPQIGTTIQIKIPADQISTINQTLNHVK